MPVQILRKHKDFSKLFYAGLTSELGSFVSETAITLYVFMLAGNDKSILGISRAVFLFFLTIGALAGGPLGEKYNRKTILLVSSYLRIPLLFILFFFDQVEMIILATGLIAFFTGIYNPSRQALINELIPQEEIKSANSLFGSTMAILHMAGPFIGALVFATTKGINEIVFFDLFTYIIGIFLLMQIKYIKYEKPKENLSNDQGSTSSFFKDLKDGFSYINKRSDLRAILKNTLFNGLCIGILIPLLLPFATEELKVNETSYGILLAIFGLGGIVGGIMAKVLSAFFKDGPIVITMIALEPILMIIWLNIFNFYLNSFIFFIWGIVVFTRITAQLNQVSDTVETKYLTRVHSLLDLAFIVPNIGSGILVAIFSKHYSTMQILDSASYVYILTILYCVFAKDSRYLFSSMQGKVDRSQVV